MSRTFHWLPTDIDEQPVEMICDYIAVLSKEDEEPTQYIDEIF